MNASGVRRHTSRGRAWLRRAAIAVTAIVLIAGLPTTTSWANDLPEIEELESSLPVNGVPDSAYAPPATPPAIPEAPEPERPPEGSLKAQALEAAEAEKAEELAVIDDALTDDRIVSASAPSEIGDVPAAVSIEMKDLMSDSADERVAPENAADGRRPDSGRDAFEPEEMPEEEPTPHPSEPTPQPSSEPSSSPAALTGTTTAPAFVRSVAHATTQAAPHTLAMTSSVDYCAPVPGVDYEGSVAIQEMVQPVWNNRDGVYRIRVDNYGTQSWPTGSAVSYQVFDTAGNLVPGSRPSTTIPLAVGANGGWVSFDATVGRLAPGTWLLAWDIYVPSGGWLTGHGVCSSNFQLTVHNQPPSLTYATPASPGTVTTRSPQLSVLASDVDMWPGHGVTAEFILCTNPELTAGCQQSGTVGTGSPGSPLVRGGPSWTPSSLQWGGTYYWAATVSDGTTQTDGRSAVQTFTVVVPAADEWRQVGNGLGLSDVFGVVLPYGVFLHRQTDAEVMGGDFPLSIERTFSSGATSTDGAFGRGWLSLFDAQLVWNASSDLLRVTYPDGRQESFGRNSTGQWIGRAELGATTRVLAHTSSTTQIQQASGETVTYESSTGRLTKVELPGAGSWELTYINGLPRRVTQEPSGRSIEVEWSNTSSSSCVSSTPRPTRPYVSALSVDRGEGLQAARWTYSYYCSQLQSVTDPEGGTHRYGMSATGFSATTPEGRQTRSLVSSGTWTNVPNQYMQRTITIGEPGSLDRKIRLLRPPSLGDSSSYRSAYNSFNGVTAMYCPYRDARNNAEYCYDSYETLEFDTAGRLRVKGNREDGSGSGTGNPRLWQYSATTGQLTSMIDESFNVVSYTYDGWGNPKGSYTMRDANTQVTSTSYFRPDDADPQGVPRLRGSRISPTQAESTIYGGEYSSQYTYDETGRLVAHDGPSVPGQPQGEQRSYGYTTGTEPAVDGDGDAPSGLTMPAGLLRTETDAAGTITSSYNEHGDLTRVESPGGASVARAYDARGYLVSEVINGTAGAYYTRDALGRVVHETYSCVVNAVTLMYTKRVTERAYDRDGLPVLVREWEENCNGGGEVGTSRETWYSYTPQGRLESVADAVGGVTRYEYSPTNPDLLVKSIDARGRQTENFYESTTGRLYRVVADVGKPGATSKVDLAWYAYDKAGRLYYELDALRRSTIYEYSDDGYPLRALRPGVVSDGSARVVTLWDRQYDGAGNVIRETLGGERTTEYVYDALSRLVSWTLDPNGLERTTTIERDAAGRTIGTTVSNWYETERTTFDLNAAGDIVAEHVWLDNQRALTTRYVRDVWGNAQQTIDPRAEADLSSTSRYTSFAEADELGRVAYSRGPLVNLDLPRSRTGDAAYTEFRQIQTRSSSAVGFNAFGEVTSVMGAAGEVTEYVRDAAGRVIETRLPRYSPQGGTTVESVLRDEYNAAGDLVRKIDARGGVTDYVYDIAGNLVEEQGPAVDGARPVIRYGYDAAGQLTETTSASGTRTVFAYDALGHRVAETVKKRVDPTSATSATIDHTTSYSYNDVGDLSSMTTPAGRRTWYWSDSSGAVRLMAEQGRGTRSFDYDVRGRLVTEADEPGHAIEHVFDRAGREIQTRIRGSDGSNIHTWRDFDAAGNVIAEYDGRGTKTSYTVDAAGRTTRISQPVTDDRSIETEIGYDEAGRPVRVRNGNGIDTWFAYNAWGLRERVIEAPTARHPALADRQWVSTFDTAGNETRVVKPGGVEVSTEYDARERPVGVTATDTTNAPLTYEYDLEGRLTAADTASAPALTFGWDDLGRLTSSHSPAGTTNFAYDADGLVTQQSGYGGTTTYERNGAGDVVVTTHRNGAGPQYQWRDQRDAVTGDLIRRQSDVGVTEWGRDPFGRVNSIVTRNADGATIQDVHYAYDANDNVVTKASTTEFQSKGNYTYDLADRLIAWEHGEGIYKRYYDWDDAGNRTAERINITTREWAYDERNRLTSTRFDDDYTLPVPTAIQVDARGNVVSIGARQLEYDRLDELVADGEVEYAYDALGRVSQRETETIAYVGFDIDPTRAVDSELAAENAIRAADGSLLGTSGAYGTRTSFADGHGDHNGGMRLAGSPAGQKEGAQRFDPFGMPVSSSASPLGTGANRASTFGFQSDWTDAKTGTVYMGARWYDPSLGTFLSRDSTDLPLTSPGAVNRYGYGDANPVSNHDPTGRYSTGTLTAPPIVDEWLTNIQKMWDLPFDESMRPGGPGTGVGTSVAEEVGKRGLWRQALRWMARIAVRAVPVVGWGVLAVEIIGVAAGLLNPPTPAPAPVPPAVPERSPHVVSHQTWGTWENPSSRAFVENVGGYRVVTRDWLADLYRHTRTDWSNGAWQYTKTFEGRFITQTIREVQGRVIDPTRVDYSHESPIEDRRPGAGGDVSSTASAGGQCGLSGTLESCLAAEPTLVGSCAGWSSPAQICAPRVALPGTPGGTGPATPTGPGTAPAPTPATATGGKGGKGGSISPPAGASGDMCEPGDGSDDSVTWGGRDASYRSHLADYLGSAPSGEYDAHHVLPVQFGRRFAQLGIDANDPQFGSWVDRCSHQGFSRSYNEDWYEFLRTSPTYEDVLDFGRVMGGKYGFDVHF